MVASTAPGGYVGRALRAATLEYEEERSLRDTIDWISMDAPRMRDLIDDPVLAVHSEVTFSSLPNVGGRSTSGKADLVADRLREVGFDVLYVDFSPPGVRTCGSSGPSCPAWRSRRRATAGSGPATCDACSLATTVSPDQATPPAQRPGAHRILLPEREREAFGGMAWLDVDALARTVGRLYPLYREPSRHVATLVAEGVL